MQALKLTAAGGPEALALEEIDTPTPSGGDALVQVHAAAITRGELEWPVDRLPAIPSYEVSGVVADVGPEAGDVAVGDEVYALTGFDRDGAAAEYAVVASDVLAPKLQTLDHARSAAVPMGGLSAWQALYDHGQLAEGKRVLIHGAAGGVGQFAVQLAKARGAHVIAPVSAANVDRVRALGADEVFDHGHERFEDVAGKVDLVFDTVGGDRLARSPAVLGEGGRLVSIAEEPPSGTGTYFIVEPSREQLVELARLVDDGAVTPTIDAVFPLADARAAFERSLGAHGAGKIVLEVG